MLVFIPVITLLASALLPAVGALPTAYPIQARCGGPDSTSVAPPAPPAPSASPAPPAPPAPPASPNTVDNGAGPATSSPSDNVVSATGPVSSNFDTAPSVPNAPNGIDADVGTVINGASNLKVGLGLTASYGGGVGGNTVGADDSDDNDDGSLDIWVWANDLDESVRAIIVKLDGEVDLSSSCQDIINEINASLTVFASIKVYSKDHLSAMVKLFADLYIDIVLAICKYSASSIAASVSMLVQLDGCLKGLVAALDVQYDGFIGLCASVITGAGLGLHTFTQVSFKLCASAFFGGN